MDEGRAGDGSGWADLKRRRALNGSHALFRDKVLALLFFFRARAPTPAETGMATRQACHVIDSKTAQIHHGDTGRIGEIVGRYADGIAIRHCDWGEGTSISRGREQPRPGAEHAVRLLPPSGACRPDDHDRALWRDLRGKVLNVRTRTRRATRSTVVPQSLIC